MSQQTFSGTATYGPVTVPLYTKLTLWGDFVGRTTNGLAKHFVFWVETRRGTYTVSTPHGLILRPVWSYPVDFW